ncbi:hypothetical protein HDV00_007739 [Rhizophlyctis rosea]|nr:hypothetical protein HDV00_007739 [Rhizophlyctis rosea]
MTVTTASHPLDSLTVAEITAVTKLVNANPPPKALPSYHFNAIALHEPPKYDLLKFEAGTAPCPPRQADVILISKTGDVFEGVVSIDGGEVLGWKHVPGVQPCLTPEDCFLAEAIVKACPEVLKAVQERGIDSMEHVVADPWSYGYHGEPELVGKRIVQTFMYLKSGDAEDNHYAHPLDIVPVVDMNASKVIKIDTQKGAPGSLKTPKEDFNYAAKFMEGKYRDGIKPLDIVQPEGPSFTVKGSVIDWQKWSIRYGWNYREGLVLYQIGYNDKGTLRPILYRAALAEMVVPYGDPAPPFHRKAAFDVGDYGLGYCANSLTLGCDCLGTIQYFDGIMSDHAGNPFIVKNAICLHEEDAGISWKHLEYRTGMSEVRRGRRLVISFVATVVNYEYAFYWYFYQDGTIQYEIKATGELSTNVIEPDTKPLYGTLVAPQINAQYHQHLFSMRIDPMVDGVKNAVAEYDVVPMEVCDDNPYGNGFTTAETLLTSEQQAQRICNPLAGRHWKIINPSVIHPYTKSPVGFKLITNASPLLLCREGSYIANRAGFAKKHLWVTKYDASQRFPAGEYINQSVGHDGLPKWTAEDKPIYDEDIVIWHTFGVTHVPRVEDFPIMPCDMSGFALKPSGFFTENPAVDLPPSTPKKVVNGDGACCQ